MTAKTRNAIVFAFHPQAQKCSSHAAKIVYDAAIEAGAPEDFIQWIEVPSLDMTTALIQNRGLATILATGGPGMVNAALKSGNPSLGVGAGNGAVYVDATANIERAVEDLLLSKRFDNGMICATENSAVIDASVYDEFIAKMQEQGAYMVPKKDYKAIESFVFVERAGEGFGVTGPVAGRSGQWIAEQAGVKVPNDKDLLCFQSTKLKHVKKELRLYVAYLLIKVLDIMLQFKSVQWMIHSLKNMAKKLKLLVSSLTNQILLVGSEISILMQCVHHLHLELVHGGKIHFHTI